MTILNETGDFKAKAPFHPLSPLSVGFSANVFNMEGIAFPAILLLRSLRNLVIMGRKGKLGSEHVWSDLKGVKVLCEIMILSFLWYSSAVVGTVTNKKIMKVFPYPVALTVIHLCAGFLMDSFMVSRTYGRVVVRRDILWNCIPIALTLAFSKVLTYVSYGRVPVSLTHTVKSSSPIFSVALSQILGTHSSVSVDVLMTLVPITVGVTLSAFTEVEFQFFGFWAALLSSLVGVIQTILTKRVFEQTDCNPIFLHLHTTLMALFSMIPLAILSEGFSVVSSWNTASPTLEDGVISNPVDIPAFQVPLGLLCISVVSHYFQTISSTLVLSKLSVTSHQVFSTMKRLVVIIMSIMYFAHPVSWMNCIGMLLALSGFCSYGLVQMKLKKSRKEIMHSHHSIRKHSLPDILPKYEHSHTTLRERRATVSHHDPASETQVEVTVVWKDREGDPLSNMVIKV